MHGRWRSDHLHGIGAVGETVRLAATGRGEIISGNQTAGVFGNTTVELTEYMMLDLGTEKQTRKTKCWLANEVNFDIALGMDWVQNVVVDRLESCKSVVYHFGDGKTAEMTKMMTNAQVKEKMRELDEWFERGDFRLPVRITSPP